EPGYGLEGAIPDAIANRVIQEYLVPHFRQNDYAGGITAATAVLVKLIDGEELPPPVSSNREPGGGGGESPVLFAIVIGVVASTFMRALLSRLPRAVRGLVAGVVAGGAGLLLLSMVGGGIAALVAFFLSLGNASRGGFARGGGWGGGGCRCGGGGGGGGFGGGGCRGGGGRRGCRWCVPAAAVDGGRGHRGAGRGRPLSRQCVTRRVGAWRRLGRGRIWCRWKCRRRWLRARRRLGRWWWSFRRRWRLG